MADGPIKSTIKGGVAAGAGAVAADVTKNAMGLTGPKATYGSDIGNTLLTVGAGVGLVNAGPEVAPVEVTMFTARASSPHTGS